MENIFCIVNFAAKLAEINCQPKTPKEHRGDYFGVEVLRAYLTILCEIYFRYESFQKKPETRQESWKQLQKLYAWFAREIDGQITFGDSLDTPKVHPHCGNCHAEIYAENPRVGGRCRYCHHKTEKPHDVPQYTIERSWEGSGDEPLPFPENRDVSASPSVRVTFEPIRKKETKSFQEELESISALQLGQRIVTKRYQFNGLHGNYLHSKMIVTETPEEILDRPILDDEIEYVEVIDDPSTWLKPPQEKGLNIAGLINKFNKRRHA